MDIPSSIRSRKGVLAGDGRHAAHQFGSQGVEQADHHNESGDPLAYREPGNAHNEAGQQQEPDENGSDQKTDHAQQDDQRAADIRTGAAHAHGDENRQEKNDQDVVEHGRAQQPQPDAGAQDLHLDQRLR